MRPAVEELVVRPARAADLDAIARLQEASIMALGVPTYSRTQARAWARFGTECRHNLLDQGSFFVAQAQGRAVGVGGWSPDSQDPGLGWLRYLFVHPDAAGRGIGRRLVEVAERSARGAGKRRFKVWSSLNAIAFYQVLGYRRLRAGRWPVEPGVEMDYELLSKELVATPPAHARRPPGRAAS